MSIVKKDLSHTSTLADTIYKHIKKLIIKGELKPDQKVTIKEFSDYFNVSLTPVREAAQRLLAEKYLSISTRSEFKIVGLSLDEIEMVFELNKVLDLYGIEKNLKNFPDKMIDEIEKMNNRLKEYYKRKNNKLYFNQTMKIHHRIWQEYSNKYIYQTLVNAQDLISIFAKIYFDDYYTPETLRKSYNDHMDLADAIKRRDITFAKEVLRRHWEELFEMNEIRKKEQEKRG